MVPRIIATSGRPQPSAGENRRVQPQLPTGTVTFLFTDIEGSTRLLRSSATGTRTCSPSTAARCGSRGGGTTASRSTRRATPSSSPSRARPMPWRPPPTRNSRLRPDRCGCGWGCTRGSRSLTDEGYVGLDVHRAARIAAAGHGGQVLLSQATADLAGADVRDLGLHRLKDLSAPERLFQLGTEDFPPLKTLHETNLPVPATPFLGREREIDEIAALLRRPDVRLVTLTGPGGSGKTRLALQAAAAAADDYDRGVWWVPLASLADPALVETAAAQALGSKDTLVGRGRRQAAAARARQLRASARRGRGRRRDDRLVSAADGARHEPRAAARRRRVGGRRRPAARAGSGRALRAACRSPSAPTSPRTARSPRSAGASTACRSRSSWLPRA